MEAAKDDALDVGIFAEDRLRGFLVAQVDLLESRAHTGYLLDAVEHLDFGVGEIVDNHHLIASLNELHGGMGTDEPGSACYENSLFHFFLY